MLKKFQQTALIFTALFLFGLGAAFGGQALVAPVKDFYDSSALVVIMDVKKVTQVEVPTGDDQTSIVYVAAAEVLETIKSDQNPTPENRKIALVGSTIPRSSAVWEPIECKRYLAFLNPEQGHYRFGEKYALRPVSDDGKVAWIEKNAKGEFEILAIDLSDAVKRIRSLQTEAAQPATGPNAK